MKIIADANIPFVAECFSSIGEVEVIRGREIKPSVVADADILLVRSVTRVDSNLLAGSKVRFVATATIGFEHVDVDFLQDKGIGFASAPGSNANSVAEYIVAALLEIGQKYEIDLQDKSIGIIGVGNVGSRVEKKAKALGMKVYLNDPPLQRQTNDTKYLPLERLFKCDIITLHTPLIFEGIDRTFHLADERFFKSLKKGCTFINTSRGGVVDTAALKNTVKSGKLGTVVLDVWKDEPNIDMELLGMVDIGTPHIAGYSLDGKIAGMIMIYKAACEYFGIKAKYDIDSFLPEAAVGRLKINPEIGSEQDVLQQAVVKIYNIKEDDSRLRKILDMSAKKRGSFFDGLRKNYPVRREFQNTKIIIATECIPLRRGFGGQAENIEIKLKQDSKMKDIAEKLAGIGFKV